MNYKLDYITRIFKKTNHKRIENYVITRIWHLLNSDEIKIMHQQFVNRGQGQHALTDLYFPQINFHVEVDEEYHSNNKEKDEVRETEITERTGHILKRINCQNVVHFKEIHDQIDGIVGEIKELVKKEKELNRFIPWHEDELTPKFWKSRGVINVEDNVNLRTIEDIGLLFDVKIAHRGYLKAGAAKYDKSGFAEVWWPSAAKRANWENKFSSDFTVITERNLDSLKAEKHVQSTIAKNPNIKRIVFFKYRDELGFDYYKFVGCFELNPDKTLKEKQLVWERISQMYSFEEKKSEQKVPSD